jgi:hypothetical protein
MDFVKEKQKLPYSIKWPTKLKQYLNDEINYPIVYNRFSKEAHCLSCGKDYKYLNRYRADDYEICPCCGKRRATWSHTRNMIVDRTLIFATHTDNDIRIAVASVFYRYVADDWNHIKDIKAEISIDEVLFFSRDKQEAWYRNWWNRSPKEQFRKDTGKGIRTFIPAELRRYQCSMHASVQDALSNGFLKYANIGIHDAYDESHLMKLIYVYSKYPQAEYLKKLGYEEIIKDRIYNQANHIKVNWRGDSLEKMLGITKTEIGKLNQWEYRSTDNIGTYKFLKKYQAKISKKNMDAFNSVFLSVSDYLRDFTKEENPIKISEYISRQGKLANHRFILHDYKDYLSQLKKLGYPLEEYYLYPKNLEDAHAKLTKEMNKRQDEEKRKQIELQEKGYREILKKIKKLTYSSANLVIRPVNSIAELNAEGMKMHHCVATYKNKVVAEKCYIFTVRDINEPDEPIATLELSQNKKTIIQLRGKYNAVVSDEIDAFCDHWLKHIVNSKEKRKKAS